MLQAYLNGVWSGFQLGAACPDPGWVPVNIPPTAPDALFRTDPGWMQGDCLPPRAAVSYSKSAPAATCVVQEDGRCYDPVHRCYVTPQGTCTTEAGCPTGWFSYNNACYPPGAWIYEGGKPKCQVAGGKCVPLCNLDTLTVGTRCPTDSIPYSSGVVRWPAPNKAFLKPCVGCEIPISVFVDYQGAFPFQLTDAGISKDTPLQTASSGGVALTTLYVSWSGEYRKLMEVLAEWDAAGTEIIGLDGKPMRVCKVDACFISGKCYSKGTRMEMGAGNYCYIDSGCGCSGGNSGVEYDKPIPVKEEAIPVFDFDMCGAVGGLLDPASGSCRTTEGKNVDLTALCAQKGGTWDASLKACRRGSFDSEVIKACTNKGGTYDPTKAQCVGGRDVGETNYLPWILGAIGAVGLAFYIRRQREA